MPVLLRALRLVEKALLPLIPTTAAILWVVPSGTAMNFVLLFLTVWCHFHRPPPLLTPTCASLNCKQSANSCRHKQLKELASYLQVGVKIKSGEAKADKLCSQSGRHSSKLPQSKISILMMHQRMNAGGGYTSIIIFGGNNLTGCQLQNRHSRHTVTLHFTTLHRLQDPRIVINSPPLLLCSM